MEQPMGLADELERLKALHEQGALTEEEFALAKRRILEGGPIPPRAGPAPEAGTPPKSALREFRRSTTDRWIGGVCGGLEGITDVPSWTWRILFVLLALLHGVGLVLYVLLWIFVPLQATALPAPAPAVAPPPGPPPSTSPPANG
jgi:phage shock protein C